MLSSPQTPTRDTLLALAAAQPILTLTPREHVTDQMLRDLARGDAGRDLGEISADDQRTLAMLLPDICGELIARRAAMRALAAAQPILTLTPREHVTDQMLRDLARGDAGRDLGEISPDDQRTLAMLLPDICGELIARRAAMRADADA